MTEKGPFRTTLGGHLVDILKEMAENSTLVDIFLNSSPMSTIEEKLLEKETKGVRIIVVGEDHIVLGPMRPIVSSFIPFSEILMVRVAQTDSNDHSDAEYPLSPYEEDPMYFDDDEDDNYLIPDGDVHFVEPAEFGEAIADTPVVVVILVESKETPRIDRIMEKLAEEFDDEALFVKVIPNSMVKLELGIEKLPAVVILSEDEIYSQIEGISNIKKYRCDIDEAIDEIEDEDEDCDC
ncbi:MAG: hypothetical protein ACTSWA_10615 [Candidatus Thorarchaeota archaeon]